MSDAAPSRFLSDRQRRVVGFSLTLLALLATAALLVFAFVLLGRLTSFFSGVLWPIAVAAVVALVLRPIVELLEPRMGGRRLAAVIVLYGVFLAAVWGATLLLIPPLIEQLLNLIAYLPTFWQTASAYVQRSYPEWIALIQQQMAHPLIKQTSDNLLAELNNLLAHALPSLRSAGIGLMGLGTFFAHLAIVPVYLFFFLLSRGEPAPAIGRHLTFLSPGVRDDVVFLLREFVGIIVAFFRGQLIIALIMGVLLAAGFSLVGLKFGLFIGLMLGVLNIVPYLGTILGLLITLPLAFFQPEGGWQLIGLVLIVYIVVQLIESWLLTPKIMGDRTGLHPVTIIVSIFFWGTAFGGILGMLFAIPLTAFFVTVWRLLQHKYFQAEATA